MSGNTVFAGTKSAVFRSPDTGSSWIKIRSQADAGILSLAAGDSSVFFGTATGVFRSLDNGGSWTRADDGIPDSPVSRLAVFGTLIFAGSDTGMFRSDDAGDSWIRLDSPYLPQIVIGATTCFSHAGGKIFRSMDRGDTWVQLDIGNVSSMGAIGSTLFASSRNFGLKRSVDNGTTWDSFNGGLTNFEISRLDVVGASLFILDNATTLRSGDGGMTWVESGSGLQGRTLHMVGTGSALIANTGDDGGLFRSLDNGRSWSYLKHSMSTILINSLFHRDGALFAGSRAAIFRSVDEGDSWERVLGAAGTSFAAKGPMLFVAAGGGVHRSNDTGKTWSPADRGLEEQRVLSVCVRDTVLFAGTTRSLYRSMDGGDSWSPANAGMQAIPIDFLAAKGALLIAGSRSSPNNFRTFDDGASWSPSAGIGFVRAMAANESAVFAAGAPNAFKRSLDYGETWQDVVRTANSSEFTAFAVLGSSIAAGTSLDGLYFFRGNGNSWTQYKDAPTGSNPIYLALAANDSMLFAGFSIAATGDSGNVWKRPLSDFQSSIGIRPGKSRRVADDGPLSPGRPFRFTLGEKCRVKLEMFDADGGRVATVLDRMLPAGDHQASLDLSGPAGLYFVRLRTGGRDQVWPLARMNPR